MFHNLFKKSYEGQIPNKTGQDDILEYNAFLSTKTSFWIYTLDRYIRFFQLFGYKTLKFIYKNYNKHSQIYPLRQFKIVNLLK